MILVDTALEKRKSAGNPVRVALVGSGFSARAVALNIITGVPGMELVAIANRTLERARRAYREAGVDSVKSVETVAQLEQAIHSGECAITDDAMLVCQAAGIEAIIDATGQVEFGAGVALKAFENGKHVILMNAELDATLGPILKVYADRAGVVLTDTDGEEPGVAMNLYRLAKAMGYQPVATGNIKGILDRYRNPDTQRERAAQWNQSAPMITSFADGTKLSMECTIMANATGFRAGKRGMYGPACADVREAATLFPTDQLLNGGLVDYVLGAEPRTGAWVLAYTEHPVKKFYLDLFKLGSGPFYCLYTPYHLPPLQIASSVARAVLFHDATVAPLGAPVCDVLAAAKRDLKAGEVLDGIGGFMAYGLIDNAEVLRAEGLLPVGLSEGCRLKRDLPKDATIRYADVVMPEGRLCDKLRAEQDNYFSATVSARMASR
ncbi:MAG TPA: Gfo/Idh/MocA family oxidoreductase [Candidatus Acidoferrum sp.]|nr:Gfo/Idh/MocA family oxidoreductase [Candidatus Acidoferrum sp.]